MLNSKHVGLEEYGRQEGRKRAGSWQRICGNEYQLVSRIGQSARSREWQALQNHPHHRHHGFDDFSRQQNLGCG